VNTHYLYFGKHRGRALPDVPTSYLAWLLRDCHSLSRALRGAVAAELVRRGVAPPTPTPPPPAPCPGCGSATFRHAWQEDRAGGRRIRRTCHRCGTFGGWAPQLPPYLAEADAAASPTPLLDVLTRLDDLGLVLVSDGERVWVPWPDCDVLPPDLRELIHSCSHSLAVRMGNTAGQATLDGDEN
jgi:hypothetical protein